jgi:DNA-directed RNA polymerase subunit H (RpoH/RPB5)
MADIFRVFTAYSVLLEIMKSRGFDISEYEGFSKTQVAGMLASNQMDLMLKSPTKNVYVRYELERAPDLLKLAEQFFEAFDETPPILTHDDDLIVVSKESVLNDSKIEILNDLWENRKLYISIFSLADLQFNKFKAALVPSKVDILNEEETREFKKKYYVMDITQLPTISRYDPIASLLGLRPTQICKFQRDSVAALTLDFYRVCI